MKKIVLVVLCCFAYAWADGNSPLSNQPDCNVDCKSNVIANKCSGEKGKANKLECIRKELAKCKIYCPKLPFPKLNEMYGEFAGV